ncbi:hypothetical protein Tco_1296793 [Tanacetum coccineum]
MFILYCRRAVIEDLRLAGQIKGLCAGLTVVIKEREHFIDELDILVDRECYQSGLKMTAVARVEGGVPGFHKENKGGSWFLMASEVAAGFVNDVHLLVLPLFVGSKLPLVLSSCVLMLKTSSRVKSMMFAKQLKWNWKTPLFPLTVRTSDGIFFGSAGLYLSTSSSHG